ncbi:MAG: polysaccharide deacetylase family protein [Terriglobales bacterium]
MLGYLIATAALGTATVLGYNSMAPRSQLFGATFIGRRGSRQLALTYDDGPNEPYTLRLLELLELHQVKATFFMLGCYVVAQPQVARAVAEAGHAIGNHTFSHPNLIFARREQTRLELLECERALRDAVGETTRLFRPPHGGRRPDSLRTVRALGYAPVMWSISGYDWRPDPPETIAARVTRRVRGGEVILLHDGGHLGLGTDRSSSIAATDLIIRHCREQGYEFVTVPEMLNAIG